MALQPGKRSPHTEKLVTFLSQVEPGDMVRYEEMNKHLGHGFDTQLKHRWMLTSARRILVNEMQIAFLAEHGIGLIHVPFNQRFKCAEVARRGAVARCTSGLKQLEGSYGDDISPENRNINMIYGNLLHQMRYQGNKRNLDTVIAISSKQPEMDWSKRRSISDIIKDHKQSSTEESDKVTKVL